MGKGLPISQTCLQTKENTWPSKSNSIRLKRKLIPKDGTSESSVLNHAPDASQAS